MLSCIVMIMIIGLLEPWIKRALFITADNGCAKFFYNNNIEERKSARASLNPYFKRSACVYRLLRGSGWTCELLPTAYRLMRTELQSFTQMILFFSLFLSPQWLRIPPLSFFRVSGEWEELSTRSNLILLAVAMEHSLLEKIISLPRWVCFERWIVTTWD